MKVTTKLLGSLITLGATVINSSYVLAGAVTSKEEIAISTNGGGIKVKSDTGNTFEFGGRIQYDYTTFDDAYNNGDSGSESEFRRTRLEFKGSSGTDWLYEFKFDINDGSDEANIDEANVTFARWDAANIRLGRFKAPFGLEELTSSKWISTMERPVTAEVGSFLRSKPDFQLGVWSHVGNFFGQAAIADEGNQDSTGSDAYSIAARLGNRFMFGEDDHFLHAAASYALRDFSNRGTVQFRSRFGVHTLVDRLKVGNNAGDVFEVEDADQGGLELAYVNGPFSLQSEYMMVEYNGDSNPVGEVANTDVDVEGYYLQAAYTLTGESRGYKGEVGAFDKIKPNGPLGAWELIARYEDGEVDPDNQSTAKFDLLTLGVNWYANNNLRFMLNYLDLDTDNFFVGNTSLDAAGNTDGNGVTLRAQYAF